MTMMHDGDDQEKRGSSRGRDDGCMLTILRLYVPCIVQHTSPLQVRYADEELHQMSTEFPTTLLGARHSDMSYLSRQLSTSCSSESCPSLRRRTSFTRSFLPTAPSSTSIFSAVSMRRSGAQLVVRSADFGVPAGPADVNCAFVKYANRDQAQNAIGVLNGRVVLRVTCVCNQQDTVVDHCCRSHQGSNEPLVVKFADTKKQKEKKMQMQGQMQQINLPTPLSNLSSPWPPPLAYPEVNCISSFFLPVYPCRRIVSMASILRPMSRICLCPRRALQVSNEYSSFV